MEDRDLRVSDAEREHVGELLQKAVGQGMLSLGEFTERMDTVLASKTRGDLNSVIVDLPGITLDGNLVAQANVMQQPAVAQAAHQMHQVHSYGGTDNVVRGRMSGITRSGAWHVPPVVAVDTRMCSVTLDFTKAIMSTQVVRIDIDDYASSISLVVPAEATVDLNGVETIDSNATTRVKSGPPYGPLHLVVRGKVRFGNVTAKYPFGSSIRKMFGQ
ncbi:DUF1707 domain-containing protein [Rhodococcus sp. NPDC058521]|uniref:DUF1707 SHOCT-like domain-containing protein n=1 Tax=Rhodococcus sp. NPDC058521 TaxID=3346536 RepID=UPI0036674CA2